MLHNPDKKVDVVAEESKQIKQPETQVSSQPKIEEVKQVPGQREQDASLHKSIIITGKLIFKAKQAHLPKLSNLGSKRQPRALQLFLLGVRLMPIRSTLLTSTRRKVMQVLMEVKLVTVVNFRLQIVLRLICCNIFRR